MTVIGSNIAAGGGLPMDGASSVGKAAGSGAGSDNGVEGFGKALKSMLGNLNETQVAGDVAAEELATGKTEDIAQAMLQVERASVSLQMATAVRNKAIEAYQEVLRMQV